MVCACVPTWPRVQRASVPRLMVCFLKCDVCVIYSTAGDLMSA
jgi:hypothetical protein